ncbi:putative histone h1.3 [Aspergillus saccharolyticus JOP 1030-1]|uniref:Uncharacterized protein n=1 Tax=Aspergillus saccharolyticus JOP 1030-1 TaxID=1450539 RepID=A0A318ZKR4_9EURO|nr:hypothetical protein BP01DRAFT_380582 [Aspergillus saccharolyticus JOP 1030-1]PYH47365.1 hypothetical protein BP01DRAFT_380582 [Aspergillus saccharolyticus JOP 1030-1]
MAGKAAKPEGWFGLSIHEARLIILGVMCADSSGKPDYEKIAIKGGYKNAASAMTVYRNAKRRLSDIQADCFGPAGNADGSVPATPLKTPTKRKRGKAADATPDDTLVTPSGSTLAEPAVIPKPKRVRKTPAKKTAPPMVTPKVEESDSDGDGTLKLDSLPPAQTTAEGDEDYALYYRLKQEQSTLSDVEEETAADLGDAPKEQITSSDVEEALAEFDVSAEMDAMEPANVHIKNEH